jgi:hypothetical protein
MFALTTPETITFSVAGFFVLVALLVFVRLLMRRTPPTWRLYRFGIFIERSPDEVAWPRRASPSESGAEADTWHK